MGYGVDVEINKDYISVRYKGSITEQDLSRDKHYPDLADLCKKNECSKVLLDARDLSVELEFINLFDVGNIFSEPQYWGIKIALLGKKDQVPSDKGFLESVALNRGAYLKAFTDEEEAIEWLSEE